MLHGGGSKAWLWTGKSRCQRVHKYMYQKQHELSTHIDALPGLFRRGLDWIGLDWDSHSYGYKEREQLTGARPYQPRPWGIGKSSYYLSNGQVEFDNKLSINPTLTLRANRRPVLIV